MPRRNTNPRHLWYKVRPNATLIAQARVDTRDLNETLQNRRRGYSIVTARRLIILAASSRLTASCCSTARASRIKHSSSLIGETSVRAKGAVVRRSVWMSGMKSPLARPALPRSQRIKSFQRSLCAQSAARVRRLRPAIPPRSAAAELLLWQQVPPFFGAQRRAYLVLCKARRLCYTLARANTIFRLFLGSSAVEHSTVNRMVAGSNPARGARNTSKYKAENFGDTRRRPSSSVWGHTGDAPST